MNTSMDPEVTNTTCRHLDLERYSWVFVLWECVETLLVVLTNGTTLFILVKNDLLETSSNIFIACLSLSDMFSTAGLPFSLSVAYLDPGIGLDVSCFGNILINQVSSMMNIITLFVIAIDRLVYIVYSLEYHSLVPVTKAVRVVYGVWGMTVLFCITTLGAGYKTSSSCGPCNASYNMKTASKLIYGIPMVTLIPATIGIYIKIGLVAWKQRNRIAAANSNTNNPTAAPTPAEGSKITKVMLNVLVVYVTCNLVVVFTPVALNRFPERYRVLAVRVGYIIWRLNRWINPFIYAGKSEKFRHYVVKLFRHVPAGAGQSRVLF